MTGILEARMESLNEGKCWEMSPTCPVKVATITSVGIPGPGVDSRLSTKFDSAEPEVPVVARMNSILQGEHQFKEPPN